MTPVRSASCLLTKYTKLEALWAEAERTLTRLQFRRLEKFVCWEDEHRRHELGVPFRVHCLGLRHVNGRYRLCYGSFQRCWGEPDPEVTNWRPIVEGSAAARVHLARHLFGFRKAILEAALPYTGRIETALETLDRFLALDTVNVDAVDDDALPMEEEYGSLLGVICCDQEEEAQQSQQ